MRTAGAPHDPVKETVKLLRDLAQAARHSADIHPDPDEHARRLRLAETWESRAESLVRRDIKPHNP